MMTLYRIRSYYPNGRFTSCEHIYLARDSSSALSRFLREYPAHKACIQTAEEYDPEKDPEHFAACLRCGCVHYW